MFLDVTERDENRRNKGQTKRDVNERTEKPKGKFTVEVVQVDEGVEGEGTGGRGSW